MKNGLTKTLLFFVQTPKIWVGQTTLNREKKEDGLIKWMNKLITSFWLYFDNSFKVVEVGFSLEKIYPNINFHT